MSKVSFNIKDVEYNLYFGMDAYEIVQEKSIKATNEKNVSNFKMCSYIIFGGLVNYAILKELNKPSYEDAYLLMEQVVLEGEDLQNKIFDIWTDSVANTQLNKTLNGIKKKVEENNKKPIGTKLKRTHTGS